MGSAVRSDSSATRALFTLLTPHTLLLLSLSLRLSLYTSLSLFAASLSQLLPSRAGARMPACVSLALARCAHCRSLSLNHSLLCHKDNSFWHFRMCVCVCCFFSCSAENESKFVFFYVYAPLWLAIRAVFRSVAVPSTAVGKPQSSSSSIGSSGGSSS